MVISNDNEIKRLEYWSQMKEYVKDILTEVCGEYFFSQCEFSENFPVPFSGKIAKLPNIAMTPEVPYMNVGRLIVAPKKEGCFTIYRMFYSSGRYVIRDSVHEENLKESLLCAMRVDLYATREDRKHK